MLKNISSQKNLLELLKTIHWLLHVDWSDERHGYLSEGNILKLSNFYWEGLEFGLTSSPQGKTQAKCVQKILAEFAPLSLYGGITRARGGRGGGESERGRGGRGGGGRGRGETGERSRWRRLRLVRVEKPGVVVYRRACLQPVRDENRWNFDRL